MLRLSRRKVLLGALCSLVATAVAPLVLWGQAPKGKSADEPAASTVTVVIDYNDGVQKHFTRIPWQEGLTGLDAMQAAAEHPRGITFKYKGSGATAFLTQIDDMKNAGGGKNNWLYWVNDKPGEISFGAYELNPADVLLWKYEKYKP